MADVLKKKPVYHPDLQVLKDLDSPLKYRVKFEGKVIRAYTVRPCQGSTL